MCNCGGLPFGTNINMGIIYLPTNGTFVKGVLAFGKSIIKRLIIC